MFNKKQQQKEVILLSIKDIVANEYGPIFTAPTIGVGLRNYRQFMKDVPYKYEYALMHLGTMNPEMEIKSNVYEIDILNEVSTLPLDHPTQSIAQEIIESQQRSVGINPEELKNSRFDMIDPEFSNIKKEK